MTTFLQTFNAAAQSRETSFKKAQELRRKQLGIQGPVVTCTWLSGQRSDLDERCPVDDMHRIKERKWFPVPVLVSYQRPSMV